MAGCLVPLCDNTSHHERTGTRFLVVVLVHPPYFIVQRDVVAVILMQVCEGIYIKEDCHEPLGVMYTSDSSYIQ